MAQLANITNEQLDTVLNNFNIEIGKQSSIGLGSDEYLRSVMTKALGGEKADLLLDRILQGNDTNGLDHLKWLDAPTVAELVKNEHPQIIATILVHLDQEQASQVLEIFDTRTRSDVLTRIASLDGVQPIALRELNASLAQLLSGGEKFNSKPLGGVRAAANLLNFLPGSLEAETVEKIRAADAELAQAIVDEMFKFEDVLDLDDRGIQAVLREINGEDLIVALKVRGQGAPRQDPLQHVEPCRRSIARRPGIKGSGQIVGCGKAATRIPQNRAPPRRRRPALARQSRSNGVSDGYFGIRTIPSFSNGTVLDDVRRRPALSAP